MLQFRAMQDSDLDTMAQIVERVWDMDALCGGKKAGRFMSREYLWKTLGHSTGAQVAIWDGEVAGFLAYRETTSPYLLLPNMASEEKQQGMEILSMRRRMEEYDGLCTALLEKSGYTFDGEITLFAVAPKWQGRGIGSALFERARAYFNSRSFFLYTDTGCNYRFYDTHGLRCLAQQAHENPYKKDRPFWVFFYGVYETAFS